VECPESVYSLTADPRKAPGTPQVIELEFRQGIPVALNRRRMGPVALIETLNRLGGKHGVGRVDLTENRLVGMKSRGIYETPGGTILVEALRALETLVLDKETARFKAQVALKYADLVYNGQWYTPIRESLDAFIDSASKNSSGWVRLKLYKGSLSVAGIGSPHSLYSNDLASFATGSYNHKDAEGFINLFGLPMSVEPRFRLKKKRP
jgi:argininosuccinate synthase